MPAIKKERLDGEDMALAAFNQPEYLAPLNATAIPVVTPHPPPYDHIFAHHHRAYLGLQDSALHQQHLHHHPDDFMLERFSSIPDFQPFFDNGEPCIEVECGENKALLYINKLCQGSKGPSIKYRGEWLTPNEFQFVSGRETAKDWKRSIRHKGKSLKTLMSKGILQVHPPICDCPGCRISSPVNRGRLAEKRTIPLPPTRVPKKELASVFSSDDSEGSDRASGDHADIKQEELHYSIMRKSRDSDLSTIISNLHHTRQHGMPEGQPCSDLSLASTHSVERSVHWCRNPGLEEDAAILHDAWRWHWIPPPGSRQRLLHPLVDGSGSSASRWTAACPPSPGGDDILGKRRAYSPNSSSECPSDSKKSRSVSPKENSQTPALEPGCHMTPEEHYRRMMSALNEHGSYEEQQQRLYQLANNMGVPSHELLRVRQEAMAAVRSPGGMEAHVPTAGSSSSQRRKQGLPQHRDTHFPERDISHPPPLLSPQNAPHIALGPHLRPPFMGMPSALCQAPGYGFLQPAQAEMFARQQEILRKQNLARLEMSAELLRQKELENLHRQRLISDPLGLHPGLPAEHPALRSLQEIPEGHPLREELNRRNAMLVLRHNNTPLLSLNHQGAAAGTSSKDLSNRKSLRKGGPLRGDQQENKEMEGCTRDEDNEGQDEDMKYSENDAEVEDRPERSSKADGHGLSSDVCQGKDVTKSNEGVKELGEGSGRLSAPCSSTGPESPTHHLFTSGMSKSEAKYLPPGTMPPLPGQTLPFTFPYTSPYFHTGAMGGLFVDGEEAGAAEDISKWSVEEVFREQAIDGETLPLLTEDHLLNNMGLKLGPALKIRSQVARRIGRIFYMTSFPLALPLPPSALRSTDRDPLPAETRPPSTGSTSLPFSVPPLACRASPKQENGNSSTAGAYDSTKPPS
ncbi:sterile alpha motif domain-containing protein 11 isoform X2 [Myxocyprinus asiaticus]|uniref:sterile alpha motif domain-containing protein 11 isoform X2 n=1 Tax=Myxocyprinus asiaticus TaxID=70543 RepID=UPI0022228B33|nr:sterile alpha motif domain-containing protein 11 isoform X2 [Myxocyprinus asiaticus]